MKDKEYTCADRIIKYIIWGLIIVIVINIFGFFCLYFMLKKKIYHTYFMTRESLEKIHNVDIDLDTSVGHIVTEKK